ncbi:hypothetical protein HIM_01051 [Hirsutella minnesotensis 3608]|nr:hypothetical protein HIM_01051 [Hirsutella minnesotensis 3608]
MPAPGDQHTSWVNPFEEAKPRVSEWTAKEIATISSKLDKQLGPEYISSRSGPGGSRVHYLTAEKCIGLANEVFGFNGWSSSIQNIQVDFADENPQTQRVSIGLSVIVRITLRDGTYHEDIGYGSIENARGKAMAFEKAKKEGTTDGLKRALRSFGNVLGNCIYDQDYVKQVTKVKAQPVKKFDQDNLHRHADFVRKETIKTETTSNTAVVPLKLDASESFDDFLGELDEADFCVPGEGHPDEIMVPLPVAKPAPQPQIQPPARTYSTNASTVGANNGNQRPQTPNSGVRHSLPHAEAPNNQPMPAKDRDSNHALPPPSRPGPQQNNNSAEPMAFFSARSVGQNLDAPMGGQAGTFQGGPAKQLFNPKAESPSIRKTPGIDHSSSRPLARNGQHVVPTASQASVGQGSGAGGHTPGRPSINGARSNVVNPSLDQTRRIGAPGGPGSPLANRGSYKPPTMKRPLPSDANSTNAARSPLVDIATNTSGQGNATAGDGADAKRQRM